MRFLLSNPRRTAAEILLTVAIIAFVVYDLSDHSAKPEASNLVLSFEGKVRSESATSSPASQSTASRFQVAYSSSITGANVLTVCGDTVAPTNPWLVGNSTVNQVLLVHLDSEAGCTPNPAITYVDATNTTVKAAITVAAGSFLTFHDVSFAGSLYGATSGLLAMASGSTLETIISATLVKNPRGTTSYNLLLAQGPCPTFSGVSFPISHCPSDTTYAVVGSYICAVSSSTLVLNGYYCNIVLNIAGPLSQQGTPQTFLLNSLDCATFSQADFKAAVYASTQIPPEAILILGWACGSITVIFAVLGNNPALIAAATSAILAAAAPGGALYNALGGIVINPGTNVVITTAVRSSSYYAVPYCAYYFCPTIHDFTSRSNPGLFALLTLLVIPVAIAVGLLIWCCLPRAPVCEPMPVCPPAPMCPPAAPVVYYAEPYAVPCADPCATYSTPSTTPAAAPVLGGY